MIVSFLIILIACPHVELHNKTAPDNLASSLSSSADSSADRLIFWSVLFSDYAEGEFFSVLNPSESTLSLSNWSVTDGEGYVIFPSGATVAPNQVINVARDPQSFLGQNGHQPDYSIKDGPSFLGTLRSNGSFRLNNDGDELYMFDSNGDEVDAVLFGKVDTGGRESSNWTGERIPSPGRGRIIQRQSASDTDGKEDWLSFRERRAGQSSFPVHRSEAVVTPLLLPEHSNYVLKRLGEAQHDAFICSHEFDSEQLLGKLMQLVDRGVRVRMLIEGSPAGGLSENSKSMLFAIAQKGAIVDVMTRSEWSLRRYPCLHAKYIVIDHETSIVMSENLVGPVFDSELGFGNRGWGAIIESPSFSSRLIEIFKEDSSSAYGDTANILSGFFIPTQNCTLTVDAPPIRAVPTPQSRKCQVSLHTFPDCAKGQPVLYDLIQGSDVSIACQVFYADLYWDTWAYGEILSPIISSLEDAVSRYDQFVLCMDSSWFSEIDGRNAKVIQYLLERADAPENAFMGYPGSNAPFEVLHNKGLIVDHRYSWVSSANWNCASFCSNREIGILIDDLDIAQFFEGKISLDIFGDDNPPEMLVDLSLSRDRTDWILRMSNESDESGLSSVVFFTADTGPREWELRIGVDEEAYDVEILAWDLYGNCAEYSFTLFPDGVHPRQGVVAHRGFGLFLSVASAAAIAFLFLPQNKIKRLLCYRFGHR